MKVSLINNLPDAYKPIVEQSQSWPFQQARLQKPCRRLGTCGLDMCVLRVSDPFLEAQRTWPSMLGGTAMACRVC
eukprot:2896167-Amphidinium_carterae.1